MLLRSPTTDQPSGASIPERLGSFEIISVLGEGGSAVVYAARDGDREVALKVLHPEIGLEPREVDRFLDEADRMRRVKHRALVPVVRAGLLPGGRPYIAMPRLRGGTLAEELTKGRMPLERALPMFVDLAEGLSTLHDAGLVHRDIKPENVFFLAEEQRLVLLDLGIARDTESSPSTTTRAGLMRGTPAYMAPERFFGKLASVRSDVYELALLLYAMLTGRLPWDGDDPRGRLDPKLPSERGVLLPPALSAALVGALNVDVERRPATVRDLIASLRSAVSGGAAIANAPTELSATTPPQAQPTMASPRFESAGIAVTPHHVLAQSGAPPAMTPNAGMAANAPASSGSGKLLVVGAAIALVGAIGGAVAVGAFVMRTQTNGVAPATTTSATATAEPSASAPPPATPSPPAEASASASASETAAIPSATASDSAQLPKLPAPSAPLPPSTVTAAPSAAPADGTKVVVRDGTMPASCTQFITLMCTPSTGSTPAECSAWKENVTKWRAQLPPAEVANICSTAFTNSSKGLELRRASKPP